MSFGMIFLFFNSLERKKVKIMCWHVGEPMRVPARYFNSGEVDNFILNHNIYCPDSVFDETGKRLPDTRILPRIGDPLFLRSVPEEKTGEVIIVLKGDDSDIEKFKNRFVGRN
jgi:hypothetical protein